MGPTFWGQLYTYWELFLLLIAFLIASALVANAIAFTLGGIGAFLRWTSDWDHN